MNEVKIAFEYLPHDELSEDEQQALKERRLRVAQTYWRDTLEHVFAGVKRAKNKAISVELKELIEIEPIEKAKEYKYDALEESMDSEYVRFNPMLLGERSGYWSIEQVIDVWSSHILMQFTHTFVYAIDDELGL